MSRGLFITIEGGEGTGKSTNMRRLEQWLQSRDIPCLLTREPGGTPLAESLRNLLLQQWEDETVAVEAELLMVFAARAQHLQTVIQPALDRGQWVVCDRFTDATYAYQGGGRKMPMECIATLETLVQGELRPDVTLLLDAPVEVGMARAGERSARDRFESEGEGFFRRVRETYLERASREPERFHIIDTDRPLEDIGAELDSIMEQLADGR